MRKKYTVFVGSIILGMTIGAAIFYLFINTEEVLSSGLDDRIIEENQKSDEVEINPNNDYKQLLIGMWHTDTDVGAGYNDLYSFSDDGTFIFKYSQSDGENRIVDISGNWEIIHQNLLALTINEKSIIDLNIPEEIIYPLKEFENNEIKNSLMLKIGGKQYWKLGNQAKKNDVSVSVKGSEFK